MHFSKIELSTPAFVFEAQSDLQKNFFRESEYYKNHVSQGKQSGNSKHRKEQERHKLEAYNGGKRSNFNANRITEKQKFTKTASGVSTFGKPAKGLKERKSDKKKLLKESEKERNENGTFYKGVFIKSDKNGFLRKPESEIKKGNINGHKSSSKNQNNTNLENLLSNSGKKNCLVESEIYEESKVRKVEIANWGKGHSNNSKHLGFYINKEYSL